MLHQMHLSFYNRTHVPMEKQQHIIVREPVILINICVTRTFRESCPRTEVGPTLLRFIDMLSLETESKTDHQPSKTGVASGFVTREHVQIHDKYVIEYLVKSLERCRFGLFLYHLRAELIYRSQQSADDISVSLN